MFAWPNRQLPVPGKIAGVTECMIESASRRVLALEDGDLLCGSR